MQECSIRLCENPVSFLCEICQNKNLYCKDHQKEHLDETSHDFTNLKSAEITKLILNTEVRAETAAMIQDLISKSQSIINEVKKCRNSVIYMIYKLNKNTETSLDVKRVVLDFTKISKISKKIQEVFRQSYVTIIEERNRLEELKRKEESKRAENNKKIEALKKRDEKKRQDEQKKFEEMRLKEEQNKATWQKINEFNILNFNRKKEAMKNLNLQYSSDISSEYFDLKHARISNDMRYLFVCKRHLGKFNKIVNFIELVRNIKSVLNKEVIDIKGVRFIEVKKIKLVKSIKTVKDREVKKIKTV